MNNKNDGGIMLSKRSYENPYDKFTSEHSNDVNFSSRMWQDAIDRGETDQYASLINAAGSVPLSKEFYDPAYYNYEDMMMELYAYSDADNSAPYQHEIVQINPETQKPEQIKMDELMTDKEFILWQLSQARADRAAEIEREMELKEKEALGTMTKVGASVVTTLGSVGEGAVSAVTGLADVLVAPFAAIGKNEETQNMTYGERMVHYFAEDGLTQLEKKTLEADLLDYARRRSYMVDIDGNFVGIGQEVYGIANSIGAMLPSIITGGLGAPALAATGVFYGGMLGERIYETSSNPDLANSPAGLKIATPAITTAAELVIEQGLAAFWGATTMDTMRGTLTVNSGLGSVKVLGAKGLTKGAIWSHLAKDMVQEGLEEVFQDLSTQMINAFVDTISESKNMPTGYADDEFGFQTLVDSFISGALLSFIMTSANVAWHDVKAATFGKNRAVRGDVFYTDSEGKTQRAKGYTRVFLASVMQGYTSAVERLRKSGDIKLAGQVLVATNIMNQYFSGMSQQRLNNCMELFNKAVELSNVNASAHAESDAYLKTAPTDIEETLYMREEEVAVVNAGYKLRSIAKETGASLDTLIAAYKAKEAAVLAVESKQKGKDRYKEYATLLSKSFEASIKELSLRHFLTDKRTAKVIERVKKVIDKSKKDLAEGKTTKAVGVVSEDRNEVLSDVIQNEGVRKKILSKIKPLPKDYDNIILTDGNRIAIDDDTVFVPIDWAENKSFKEIAQAIGQIELVEALENFYEGIEDKEVKNIKPFGESKKTNFKELLDAATEVDKELRGETAPLEGDAKEIRKTVLMDVLFNEVLYQKMLLNGSPEVRRGLLNLLKATQVIVDLPKNAEHKKVLDEAVNIARAVMRVPTIKAILHFNMGIPQGSGRDFILLPADRDYIEKYRQRKGYKPRKKIATDAVSSYAEPENVLLDWLDANGHSDLSDKINKGLSAEHGSPEYLDAYLCLEILSNKRGLYGILSKADITNARYLLKDIKSSDWSDENKIRTKILDLYMLVEDPNTNNMNERFVLGEDKELIDETTGEILEDFSDKTVEEYNQARLSYLKSFVQKRIEDQMVNGDIADKDFGEFYANADAFKSGRTPAEQAEINDTLNTFVTLYDIDAELLWGITDVNELKRRSMTAYNSVSTAMLQGGYTNVQTFITDTLEALSGHKYIVLGKSQFAFSGDKADRYAAYFNFLSPIDVNNIIKPQFLGKDAAQRDNLLVNTFEAHGGTLLLSDLFTIDKNSPFYDVVEKLSKWTVSLSEDATESVGSTFSSRKEIVLYGDRINGTFIPKSQDIFRTLIHEASHALQSAYGVYTGGNPEMFENAVNLENWALVHLKTAIETYKSGTLDTYSDVFERARNGEIVNLEKEAPALKNTVDYLLYLSLYGELLAQRRTFNTSMPFALRLFSDSRGRSWVETPDGKNFQLDQAASSRMSQALEQIELNTDPDGYLGQTAMLQSFKNILNARKTTDPVERALLFSNTYHSKTNASVYGTLNRWLRTDISPAYRVSASINNIINNPRQFLSEAFMSDVEAVSEDFGITLNWNNKESVYTALRLFLENSGTELSIDIDANTHEYIIVSDNAFDELLNDEGNYLAYSDEETLSARVNEANTVLTMAAEDFYDGAKLRELGLDGRITVYLTKGGSITRVAGDGTYKVYVNCREGKSDADVINTLNHEFRHVLQYESGFEAGFTSDFKYSKDFLADVKKHLPAIFNDTSLRNWARAAGLTTDEAIDDFIFRQMVYYLTSGEIEAYGIAAELLSGHRFFVTWAAGSNKPTVHTPWGSSFEVETSISKEEHDTLVLTTNFKKSQGAILKELDKEEEKQSKARYKQEVDALEKEIDDRFGKSVGVDIRDAVFGKTKAKRNEAKDRVVDYTMSTVTEYTSEEERLSEARALADDIINEYKAKLSKVSKRYAYTSRKVYKYETIGLDGKPNKLAKFYDENGRFLHPRAKSFILASGEVEEGVIPKALMDKIDNGDPSVSYSMLKDYFKKAVLDGTMSEKLFQFYKENFFWNETDITMDELTNGSIVDKGELLRPFYKVLSEHLNDYVFPADFDILDGMADADKFEAFVKDEDLLKVIRRPSGKSDYKSLSDDVQAFNENDDQREAFVFSGASDDKTRELVAAIMYNYDGSTVSTLYLANLGAKLQELRDLHSTVDYDSVAANRRVGTISDTTEKPQVWDATNWLDEEEFDMNKSEAAVESEKTASKNEASLLEQQLADATKRLRSAKTESEKRLWDAAVKKAKENLDLANAKLTSSDAVTKVVAKETSEVSRNAEREALRHSVLRLGTQVEDFLNSGINFAGKKKLVASISKYFTTTTENGKTVYTFNRDTANVGAGAVEGTTRGPKGVTLYHSLDDVVVAETRLRAFSEAVTITPKKLDLAAKATRERNKTKGALLSAQRDIKKKAAVIEQLTSENAYLSNQLKVKTKAPKDTEPKIVTIAADNNSHIPDTVATIIKNDIGGNAETLVQWVSVDEEGNVYDKQSEDEFVSANEHQVFRYTDFYKENSEIFSTLTREEFDEIFDFFLGNGDIPGNDLHEKNPDGTWTTRYAYKIGILACLWSIVQKENISRDLNYTDAEIETLRRKLEVTYSAAGSALNAVQQIQAAINPANVVGSRELSSLGFTEDDISEITDIISQVNDPKLEKLPYDEQIATRKELINKLIGFERRAAFAEMERRKDFKAMVKGKDHVYQFEVIDESTVDEKGNLLIKFRRQDFMDEEHKVTWTEEERAIHKKEYKAEKKSFIDALAEFRYLSMLSSPITAVRNLVSNVVMSGLNWSGEKVAILLGKMMPEKMAYRDIYRTTKTGDVVNEGKEYNLLVVKPGAEVNKFIEAHMLNNKQFDFLYKGKSKYDFESEDQAHTRSVLKNMILDGIAKEHYIDMSHDNVAMRYWSGVVSKMLDDSYFIKKATGKYFSKMLQVEYEQDNTILDHGLNNRVMNIFADALLAANYEYMHKPSVFQDGISQISEKSPNLGKVVRFFFPFVNSQWNWFSEMLKLTPVGLIRSCVAYGKIDSAIGKLQSERSNKKSTINPRLERYLLQRDIGKGIIGLLLSMIGSLLCVVGLLKVEEKSGKLYAKSGNVSVDISSIFGSNALFVGAALADPFVNGKDSEKWMEKLGRALDNTVNVMADGFIISDLLEDNARITDFSEWTKDQISDAFMSFTPQALQLFVRFTNSEKISYSSGIKGGVERYINSFTPTQPAGSRVIDVYTGEVKNRYEIPFVSQFLESGALAGAKIKIERPSEGEQLSKQFGLNKQELSGELTVNGAKKSISKESVNKKYGSLNQATLSVVQTQSFKVQTPNGKYVTTPWSKMTDVQKESVLERLFEKNASYAKIAQWCEEGHKYYASDSVYATLRKLGITKNVYRGDKGYVE